jgi:hypothetical protein
LKDRKVKEGGSGHRKGKQVQAGTSRLGSSELWYVHMTSIPYTYDTCMSVGIHMFIYIWRVYFINITDRIVTCLNHSEGPFGKILVICILCLDNFIPRCVLPKNFPLHVQRDRNSHYHVLFLFFVFTAQTTYYWYMREWINELWHSHLLDYLWHNS